MAHAELEQALSLSKSNCKGVTDFMQVAEVLNNLGVLTFLCGDPGKSLKLFQESLQFQHAIISHSLYDSFVLAAHGTTLNVSVTRGNIGFVKMVQKEFSAALVAFESALMVSCQYSTSFWICHVSFAELFFVYSISKCF